MIGTVIANFTDLDYSFDKEYKPGLYMQTKKFIGNDFSNMCFIKEQNEMIDTYYKIANYQ